MPGDFLEIVQYIGVKGESGWDSVASVSRSSSASCSIMAGNNGALVTDRPFFRFFLFLIFDLAVKYTFFMNALVHYYVFLLC